MSDSINKFRVWDIKREEFYDRDDFVIDSKGSFRQRTYSDLFDDIWLDALYPEYYIVERYTGLRSSNGNKAIYEGDIVKVKYTIGDHAWDDMEEEERKDQLEMSLKYYVGVVKQKMLEPCNLEFVSGNVYFPLSYVENSELLGNIHENEGLL